MATKSPSNQGGSSNGISDVKYQKAIKQISKLITLNTSIKNQNNKLQQKYNKLQSQYDSLQQKYTKLQLQFSKYKNGNIQSMDDLQFIQTKQSRLFKQNSTSQQLANIVESKKKIQLLEEKLVDKQEKIAKLKSQLQNKKIQAQGLLSKNQVLNQQLANLKASQVSEHEMDSKLKKQLQKSELSIKKISSQNQVLKRKINFNQNQSMNIRSIQIMGSTPPSSFKDPISQFYLQKLKKVQIQNTKLKKMNNQLKKKFKVQNQKLKAQKQMHLKKLLDLSNFAERQHTFIEKLLVSEKHQIIESS